MATIQFLGAAEQITGSMFLVTFNNKKLLVDCGLDFDEQNTRLPVFDFNPFEIDYVILTHAHLDHSGLIPLLVKKGFEGIIYCTYPTYQLCKGLLYDAARLNQKKVERSKRRLPKTFYNSDDVTNALDYFGAVDFDKPIKLWESISLTFNVTGHLLGAANIILEYEEGQQLRRLIFSGDVGRYKYPLLKDPQPLPNADYLVCEGTYGMREHLEQSSPLELMQKTILESCVKKSGRLIIPAFSVGRTQTILFLLHQLQASGKLPPIQIFTDSPLAKKSTMVYNDFVSFLNNEAQSFYEENGALFDFENLTYLENINSAEEIDNYGQPCVIITSSGMVRGGKSEEHILRNLNNSYCTILFVGYCAEGTLGRKLIEGLKTYRLGDDDLPIHANIISSDVLSGHGDFNDLMNLFRNQSTEKLKKVMLVHGETDALQHLKRSVAEAGFHEVEVPTKGEIIHLN